MAGMGRESALHPCIKKLFWTCRYGPYLKKPKERAGSTGKQCRNRVWQLPEQRTGMLEQDHCPACAWDPPLPSVFSPSPLEHPITCLPVALCLPPLQPIPLSHHMPITLSPRACPSHRPHHAHCTVPITSPPHCPQGMPIRLSHHMAIALSPSHAHQAAPALPIPSPPAPLPYANGYKEHLIIPVNCLCPPLFPPGDFLTNGV